MIDVMVVDDHPLTRIGLKTLLENTLDINLVAETEYCVEAFGILFNLEPDVLLLDHQTTNIPYHRISTELNKRNLKTRLLMYSAFSDEGHVLAMLDAGAQGYILKTESPFMLLDAIRTVSKGISWLSPSISNLLLRRTGWKPENDFCISNRELEVLKLLARGYSNIQIAKYLMISKATVKNHLSNIYGKLAVSSRSEAISWAWSSGLSTNELPQA